MRGSMTGLTAVLFKYNVVVILCSTNIHLLLVISSPASQIMTPGSLTWTRHKSINLQHFRFHHPQKMPCCERAWGPKPARAAQLKVSALR